VQARIESEKQVNKAELEMSVIPRNAFYLLIGLTGCYFQINAQEKTFDQNILSDKGKSAYHVLLGADVFALGGIGYSGETSTAETAVDILIEENAATEALTSVITDASPEGGLYALYGLRELKCTCLDQQANAIEKITERGARNYFGTTIPPGQVHMMSGCLGFAKKRVDVAEDIRMGKFDRWIQIKSELKASKKPKN
jgi:hypothetical protein